MSSLLCMSVFMYAWRPFTVSWLEVSNFTSMKSFGFAVQDSVSYCKFGWKITMLTSNYKVDVVPV